MTRKTHDSGISLLLVCVTSVVLLTVTVGVINLAYTALVRSELQAASDAAAFAGAQVMCSRQECWHDVLIATAKTLSAEYAHGGSTNTAETLAVSSDSGYEQATPTWNLASLQVVMERGFWNGTSFISLEHDQPFLAGVPDFAVVNALRIRISRPPLIPLLSRMLGGAAAVSASSIAVADAVSEVCAAPFAIPVCSLLNGSGSFDPGALCQADRFFTRTDRYCGKDEHCALLPSFDNEPIGSLDPGDPHLLRTYTGTIATGFETPATIAAKINYRTDRACFWDSARYDKVANHFGVVGLPGEHVPREEDIVSVFNPDTGNPEQNGCVAVRVGDPFSPLESGLTKKNSGEALVKRIALEVSDEHNPQVLHTDLTRFERNTFLRVLYPPQEENLDLLNLCEFNPHGPTAQTNNGACNSHFSLETLFALVHDKLNKFGDPRTILNTAIVKNSLRRTWAVSLPVIADFGGDAVACQGLPTDSSRSTIADNDPFVQTGSGHEWRVVGFLRAYLYDEDIGNKPYAYHVFEGTLDPKMEPHQFAFSDSEGKTLACNLVRGRLRCDTELLAAPDPINGGRRVMLVQ